MLASVFELLLHYSPVHHQGFCHSPATPLSCSPRAVSFSPLCLANYLLTTSQSPPSSTFFISTSLSPYKTLSFPLNQGLGSVSGSTNNRLPKHDRAIWKNPLGSCSPQLEHHPAQRANESSPSYPPLQLLWLLLPLLKPLLFPQLSLAAPAPPSWEPFIPTPEHYIGGLWAVSPPVFISSTISQILYR